MYAVLDNARLIYSVHTSQCTIHTVYKVKHMYSVHCTVYSVHCTLYSVHCTVYIYETCWMSLGFVICQILACQVSSVTCHVTLLPVASCVSSKVSIVVVYNQSGLYVTGYLLQMSIYITCTTWHVTCVRCQVCIYQIMNAKQFYRMISYSTISSKNLYYLWL